MVPVIAKADCLGKQELVALKHKILGEIDDNGIKIYQPSECDSNEEFKQQADLRTSMPFAIGERVARPEQSGGAGEAMVHAI